jgi:NADPH2:quinone reductase
MKAVLCKGTGGPAELVLSEVPSLAAGEGEIVIEVHAAGVNFPDILITQGKYQFKPPPPFSPGSEVAGVVKSVGAGVTEFTPGMKVMAFDSHGAFAQEMKVPAFRAAPIPEGLGMIDAASFLVAYGTGYHALVDRARVQAGETLLVLGAAGGVGLAAVEIGRASGCRVIAAASTPAKLDLAMAHGATDLVDYAAGDLKTRVRDLTAGRGVDVVFDPVGGALTEQALRTTRWGGRHLMVGFASGEIPKLPANLPLVKGSAVVGVSFNTFAQMQPQRYRQDIEELGRLLGRGALRPHVSRIFPLERVADAMAELAERRATGKIVVTLRP